MNAFPPDEFPRPWTLKFIERGGYDCMTDAYEIRDADSHLLGFFDEADFGDRAKNIAERFAQAGNGQAVDMIR